MTAVVTSRYFQLRDSFDQCRAIARSRARNFYYGMKLTPEPKRSAMYAVYAWVRAADDLADESRSDDNSGRLTVFLDQTRSTCDPDGGVHWKSPLK